MLELFGEWGMPKAVRSDNGEPFGIPSREVVPIMSLWLCAWGINPVLNRPKRPTDNANVENNQRTTARWAEAHNCADAAQLQQRLDDAVRFQREAYKVVRLGKVTRKELFGRLYENPRRFEQSLFDANLAHGLLAKATYPRRVSSSGAVSLYSKGFSVGLKYRDTVVFCRFSPVHTAWVCSHKDGHVIKTIPDDRFSRDNLYHLTVVCQ